jgi:hypothetical protein
MRAFGTFTLRPASQLLDQPRIALLDRPNVPKPTSFLLAYNGINIEHFTYKNEYKVLRGPEHALDACRPLKFPIVLTISHHEVSVGDPSGVGHLEQLQEAISFLTGRAYADSDYDYDYDYDYECNEGEWED